MVFFRTTERDEEEERDRRRDKRKDRPSTRRPRNKGELDDGEGAWEIVRKGLATTQVFHYFQSQFKGFDYLKNV